MANEIKNGTDLVNYVMARSFPAAPPEPPRTREAWIAAGHDAHTFGLRLPSAAAKAALHNAAPLPVKPVGSSID